MTKKTQKYNGCCGKSKYKSKQEDIVLKKALQERNISLTPKGVLFITLSESLGDRECNYRWKEFDEMWDKYIERLKFFDIHKLV